MTFTKWIGLKLAALALATLTPAQAQGDFALTLGGGTPGGTVEVQYRVNDYLQLRAGGNTLTLNESVEVDDIDYEGDLDFSGLSTFVEFHPLSNSFFITGGAYLGTKQIDLSSEPDLAVEIGDLIFTPAEYGRLEGEGVWDDVAPFLGIGFDNTFSKHSSWGVQAIVGAALFGSGEVDLRSVGGTLSNDPTLIAQLENEAANLEAEIEDYELYPIVQIGLSFRF